jgi:hypothetical protein
MAKPQTNTPLELKDRIKDLAYNYYYDNKRIMQELNVTNRTIIFALREESKMQYNLRITASAHAQIKEKIAKHIDSFDNSKLTTIYLKRYLETLECYLDELSSVELDRFGEILN